MIVAGTGQFEVPSGRVVDRRVRLSDIPNTILSAASLPATLGNGEDLAAVCPARRARRHAFRRSHPVGAEHAAGQVSGRRVAQSSV